MVRGAGQARRDSIESVLGRAPDRIVGLEAILGVEGRNSVERQRVEFGIGRRARGDRAHRVRVVVDGSNAVDVTGQG